MGGMALTGNKAVVYKGKGTVAVEDIGYPELILRDGPGVPKANVNRKCEHGVILKVITTNICGSDQHMVRGRTTAPEGLVLGHEITGEVIETGRDVEFIKKGDIVSVPFNINRRGLSPSLLGMDSQRKSYNFQPSVKTILDSPMIQIFLNSSSTAS